MLVLLDLQPGRAGPLDQAVRYAELLRLPHVGLAVDPEWRLGRHQRPLHQTGSIDAAEINRTSAWLAALVRACTSSASSGWSVRRRSSWPIIDSRNWCTSR